MQTFDQVVDCIRKEHEYATGWEKGNRKLSKVEGVKDNDVHTLAPLEGQPYSIMDLMTFAEKYSDEAKLAYTNFTPDGGSVRIRLIKTIGLLMRALMIHGHPMDLERLAGHSSSEFPILGGGLKTFNTLTSDEGCLIPSANTGKLRNEAPGCSPLR